MRRGPTVATEGEDALVREFERLLDRLYDHLIMPRTNAIRSHLAEMREQVAHMHETLDRLEANSEEYQSRRQTA